MGLRRLVLGLSGALHWLDKEVNDTGMLEGR